MKKFFVAFVLALLVPLATYALPTDSAPVWFGAIPPLQVDALATGDDILIYATVRNQTKDPITYTVSFGANEKVIGTKVVTIAGYTGQELSLRWNMPENATLVTATITKAFDKNKKELKEFEKTIGTVTIATTVEPKLPDMSSAKGFFGKWFAVVERWRIGKAEYFTNLKVASKAKAGETTVNDITNYLQPDAPTTPGQESPEPKQMDDGTTGAYMTLLYATAGESFFGHRTMFYIVTIFVVLFVIRFVVRRFF